MSNIWDWADLENWTMTLLDDDSPVKPPNSGGSKKEEDVVSFGCIAQCKATNQVNMTLLDKDIKRLTTACELQDKLPLFVSSTCSELGVTLLFDGENDELFSSVIKIAVLYKSAKRLREMTTTFTTVRQINATRNLLRKLKSRLTVEVDKIKDVFSTIDKECTIKYDDLTIVDLFEGEKNGAK